MAQIGFMEKWTLRYAVVGLLFLALAGIEGLMMRTNLFSPQFLSSEHFYATLSVHPIVGIYGFAYMAVMGAFYFLVPFLLKKEIRYKNLIPVNFFLQIGGVLIAWSAGFFARFSALYTLYWPLPVAFDKVPALGTLVFIVGVALIEINILLFVFNIFATVLSKSNPSPDYHLGKFLKSAFGIDRLLKVFGKRDAPEHNPKYEELPVFIVAVARGSIDTAISAVVLLLVGIVVLIYTFPAIAFGLRLDPMLVDPLIYKNVFWWGLDMIADGNVLMYTAGTWYLLIPLLLNRKLYGEAVVRTVILADLLVSLGVWSHHLLADQPQPTVMRVLSGQFITWGEFITMGLTIFACMMTIWLARPVKFTPPLKFVMGSIFGFALGGAAGLLQANYGLNVVLHNTQWVIGTHAHTMLLAGLSMLIFAVIYALIPLLTKVEIPNSGWVNFHFWGWLLGALGMTYSMGLAGIMGMLRRTIYYTPTYQPQMLIALISALLMALAFTAFLINIIKSLGLVNVINLFIPERWKPQQLRPAES